MAQFINRIIKEGQWSADDEAKIMQNIMFDCIRKVA